MAEEIIRLMFAPYSERKEMEAMHDAILSTEKPAQMSHEEFREYLNKQAPSDPEECPF